MRNGKRIAALCMAAVMLTMTACGKAETTDVPAEETAQTQAVRYTASPENVRKAETVYVNLDNSGKMQSVSVTDWLHTDKGEVAVPDKSDLDNIIDIKGDQTPRRDGDGLIWDMRGTDLYYRGTSRKKLPVEFSIEYKLDGKTVSAKTIAGKSGNVEVTVRMKNTYEKDGTYLPVIGAGMMILPEGVFSGVSVRGGISVGDGAKQIVVGMGLPGMADSLHLADGAKLGNIEIGDSFTVTAEADGFALDNLYFIVLPVCVMDLDALIPGSEEEAEKFFDQIRNVLQTIGSLDASQLVDALSGQKVEQIGSMMQEAVKMYEQNAALLDVLDKYMTQENLDNIESLLTAVQDPETAELLEKLDNPLLKRTLKGLPDVLESVQALLPVIESLQKDMEDPKVKAAVDALPQTLETLSEMKTLLDENSALLKMVADLADSDALTAVMPLVQSNDSKTVLSDLTENADELLPYLQSYIDLGKSYTMYSDAADDAETSLLFIYMTPSLRAAPKADDSVTTTAAQPWYKKLFS